MTKVLIVDDHPAVRDALSAEISRHSDLTVCGEASDVTDALQLVDREHPDVVVIDISLKTGSGIDLIKRINEHDDRVRMLVWSMHDESLYAERALRAGALGYINKQHATDEIVTAIRAIRDGRVYVNSDTANRLMLRAAGHKDAFEKSPVESLSDRELQIFDLIGRGLGTREIAQRLHLSVHTVETHRQRIKYKLAIDTTTELTRQAAQWVLEHG